MKPMGNTKRTIFIVRLALRLTVLQLGGNSRRFSQTLFDGMMELGGVYVKFLQALLLRSDVFTDQHLAQQVRIYENVDSEPIDLEAVLEKELGPSWPQQITKVSPTSFAAGSFGQVYRATLAGGQDVIIKVLRPSLRKALPYDLRLMGIIGRVISWVRPGGMMDIMELYREFRDVTTDETNYRREASFALDLYERYKGHPVITIPYTYLQLCTSNIIVQDYVGGISVSQLMQKTDDPVAYVREHLGSDLDFQLIELGYEALYGIFAHPTTPGDPHPGNIKLLPGNRVALIDFGLIAEAPSDRATLLDMMKEHAKMHAGEFDVRAFSLVLLQQYASNLVRSIDVLSKSMSNPAKVWEVLGEMANTAESVLESNRGVDLQRMFDQGRFTSAFSQIINEGNRFGLRLHYDATTLLRASQMYIGLTHGLGRHKYVFLPAYQRVIAEVERNGLATPPENLKPLSFEQAVEVVSDWLDRIATTDPMLFDKVSGHLTKRRYV